MQSFNTSTKELTMTQRTLKAMHLTLSTTARTSPDYIMLLQAIENLEYSMHRARIIPTTTPIAHIPTKVPTTSTHTPGDFMQAPVFNDDLDIRRLQYKDCLVINEAYTREEVALMSMVELRAAIDIMFPTVITVRTALPSGGVSVKHLTKKVA